MKKIIFLLALLLAHTVYAQESLPQFKLPQHATAHFISPQPIKYVDISSKDIVGDIPVPNILRLKYRDSVRNFQSAIVTITGEDFVTQYRLVPGTGESSAMVEIRAEDCRPLDLSGGSLTQEQLRKICLGLITSSEKHPVNKVNEFGMTAQVNHLYTLADYIFIDLGYRNKTRIKYDMAAIRFRIDDKKVTKASNVQSVEITPIYRLATNGQFEKRYRNILVFRKMTFPGNKVLNIELSEQPISGRVITVPVSYKRLLEADTVPIE